MTPSTRRRATQWLAADPDPETGAELRALLAGDPVDLERRFEGRLAFGTAGMRGRMGAGPLRMNRVLVRMVAAALAERVLQEREERPHVMVGYDARHKSGLFADDTARVLAARRVPVTVLPGPVPTPVLAFAVKHLDASAGVMVTASHNPRTDNGYKVYWRGGRQLAAPTDAEISRIIDRTAPPVPGDLASGDDPLVAAAGDDLIEAYLEAVAGLLAPQGSRSVRIAYTPLHGVGAATFLRALSHAGFDPPAVVAGQAEPDPDFPTAPFPNPEETGVLDPLMALAADTGADVALAHDPDADRLAVAVPAAGRWRMLTGDETGCLLAEYLLGRDEGRRDGRHRLLVNTVVSSRLLRRIAAHHGAEWAETLTGFKWIMQAHSQRASSHDLVLGYEEALGYAVGEAVSDKDGIGAALVMAELVAELKARGQTLSDLLDDLHRRHGVHASGQRSIRFESTPGREQPRERAMAALREAPPAGLAGAAVTAVHDLAAGSGDLPPADAVVLEVSGREARVIVRPSGTEPKMKVYAEAVVAPPTGGDDVPWLGPARVEARTRMAAVLDAAVGHVADPERHESDRAASADSRTGDLPARTQTADRAKPSRADDLRLIVRCIDLTTLEVSRRFSLAPGREGPLDARDQGMGGHVMVMSGAEAADPAGAAGAGAAGTEPGQASSMRDDTSMGRMAGMADAVCSPTWAEPGAGALADRVVYVACNRNDEILEIDAGDWTVRRRFATGAAPYNLDVTPDGSLLVATLKGEQAVAVISLESGEELARLATTQPITHGVVTSPDGRYAFGSNEAIGATPGTLDVFDLSALERVASAELRYQPGGIDFWRATAVP